MTDSGGLAALRPSHFSSSKDRMSALAAQSPVDLSSLPDHASTLRLIESYFDHIGVLFPYLHPGTFVATYSQFRTGSGKTKRAWVAILNMVLALALQRTSAPERSANKCYEESFMYYQRATLLCDRRILTDANLETGTCGTPHRMKSLPVRS